MTNRSLQLGWLLLLALALAGPVRAETEIQSLFRELQPQLAALRDDPFDPGALPRQRQALLSRYAGRELRIPSPPAGVERVGSRQGLWPLEFRDGRLQLVFSVSTSLGLGGQLLDSPWNYWTSNRVRRGRGLRDSEGRPCAEISGRSGYGLLLLATPTAIRPYVDDPYRQAGTALAQQLESGRYQLDFAIDVAQARSLSGKLVTHVRLAELSHVPEPAGAGRCQEGRTELFSARVDRLRIHNLASGEDLLRLRFVY